MQKVKMNVAIAGDAEPQYELKPFSFSPGDVVELHPTLAEAWVNCGHAETADEDAEITSTAHHAGEQAPAKPKKTKKSKNQQAEAEKEA